MNLVFIRHGQSLWNLENKFTGWVDIDLSERGEVERWKGGIDKEEFLEQITTNFAEFRKQVDDYKQNKTDDQA